MEKQKQPNYTRERLEGLENSARVDELCNAMLREGVEAELVASMFLAGAVKAIERSGRAGTLETVLAVAKAMQEVNREPKSVPVHKGVDEAREALAKRLGVSLEDVHRTGALAIQIFQGHADGSMSEVENPENKPMDPDTMRTVQGCVLALTREGWTPNGGLQECAMILDPEGSHVLVVIDGEGNVAATSMWCTDHDTHHTRIYAEGRRLPFNSKRYLKEGAGSTVH